MTPMGFKWLQIGPNWSKLVQKDQTKILKKNNKDKNKDHVGLVLISGLILQMVYNVKYKKISRIWETLNPSTDAGSSTIIMIFFFNLFTLKG